MVQKVAITVLILAAGMFIGSLLTPRPDREYINDLERKKEAYFRSLKEVEILKKRLHSHDSVWTEISKRHKDSLASERKRLMILKNENKRLKNRPVPNWSSTELDSIISTIIHH